MGFTFLILQGLQCCRAFDSSLLVGQSMSESFVDEKGVVGLLVLLLVSSLATSSTLQEERT